MRGGSNMERKARYTALESTMMRTMHPKYVNYFGDGTGRDTYIVLNNGGLAKKDM